MTEVKIISLNTSSKKGTVKSPVQSITIDKTGVVGDAHAGDWHRQISLLGIESYHKMEEKGAAKGNDVKLDMGVFAENITTEGLTLHETAIFDRFVCGDIILEVTQIGKKCHHGCEIMKLIGDCVMPVEGIFTQVIQGGTLNVGDTFEFQPRTIKTMILTLSDRAFNGIYADRSGPLAEKLMSDFFKANNRSFSITKNILPDDKQSIEKAIIEAKEEKYDIIITTGGTGLGRRDITPDVIKPFFDKEIPGIMEHIRLKFGAEKPNALVSRSIAGMIDETLVYVLPGSTKGVTEYLSEITKTIEHSLRMIHGVDFH